MNQESGKRKQTKKVSPKITTKEIPVPARNEPPMYDPQTGEPNPLYEELTGKKNPLIEMRKTAVNITAPIPHEPKRKNRFIVRFPEHFKIESWCVSKTQRPSVKIVEKRFLGIKYGSELQWENISFEFIDPIGPSVSERLADNMIGKTFDYVLDMVDPTGVTVERWKIENCKIEAISFGSLGYDDNGIARCFMLVKPSKVHLLKSW